MPSNQRLALLGDIGGTNARFAIGDCDEMTVTHFAAFQVRMFPSLQDTISHYLESIPFRPDLAGFAVAAPMNGETIAMTNTPWKFTVSDIRKATGASRLAFVNDFEALALSLPYLTSHDLHTIGSGTKVANAPKVVLGPGTGFGMSGLVRMQSGWTAVPGEGGHISFGATNDAEWAILNHLAENGGHVSIERLMSASGLERIYGALAKISGRASTGMKPIDIVNSAQDETDPDPHAIETLDCFVSILARLAGDAALSFGARGGVYLAGGIAPKILKTLESGVFRKKFDEKGRLSAWLSEIPVKVITANDAALRGAAFALSEKYPMATVNC
jgi:glucokinase